ncbi:MAG: HAD-IC family P-type ATPase, partial [Clostridia bacterium]|nr:HAD-IC family P-type ATPase [Clostridia bacterium]
HPLGRAIVKRAEEMSLSARETEDFEIFPGGGLRAVIGGEEAVGGNSEFVSKYVTIPSDSRFEAEVLANEGKTPLFFARSGEFLGIIAVADSLKEDSPSAISELREMGIRVVMLTGDNKKTADAIGKACGVDDVFAEVKPDGKEAVIRRLSEEGRVAMVGDGINDAPALTRADIGIAIGAGTDVAIDAADVVLVNSRLSDVPAAIRLSRATLRTIHQNLFWAFIYNAICIPIAAGAFVWAGLALNPMIGAAAMSLSSFCVVTNALRLNLIKINNKNTEENNMKKTMKIKGMMCPHCEARVKKVLEELPEVDEALVSFKKDSAVLTLNAEVSDEVLTKTVTDNGYSVIEIK